MLRSIFVFAFLIFNICGSFAQIIEPHITFIKNYGGSNFDGYAGYVGFHFTPDNNILLASSTGSTDHDAICNNSTIGKGWLLKTDKQGTPVFSICFGGTSGETFSAMQITKDSGCIVACGTRSIDSPTSYFPYACYYASNDYRDQMLIKFDKNGLVKWTHCYGPADYITNVEPTSDGGYIFLGASRYATGDVPFHWGDQFHGNGWLVKVDSIGNIQWSKILGGTGGELPRRVKEISPGKYLTSITTGSRDSMLLNIRHYSTNDAWICSFDSVGDILTSACVPWYGQNVSVNDFVTLANGDIVGVGSVAGDSSGQNVCNTMSPSNGVQNFFITKLNNGLGIDWCHVEVEGGPGSVGILQSIVSIGDSIFLICGSEEPAYDSLVCNVSDSTLISLGWLLAVNANGTVLWRKTLCGSLGSAMNNCIIDKNTNSIYVSGVGNSTNGDLTGVPNYGESDVWLIKLDYWPNGLSDMGVINNINIYPNPVSDVIKIKVENYIEDEPIFLSIINTFGQSMLSTNIAGENTDVNIQNLTSGLYIAEIHSNTKGVYCKKIIKE